MQELGATASNSIQCGVYCAVFETLSNTCSGGPDDCKDPATLAFALFQPGSTLCQQDVRYAVYASCEAEGPEFEGRVAELLEGLSTESCTVVSGVTWASVRTERL